MSTYIPLWIVAIVVVIWGINRLWAGKWWGWIAIGIGAGIGVLSWLLSVLVLVLVY